VNQYSAYLAHCTLVAFSLRGVVMLQRHMSTSKK
jgi:hypothetical protein